MKKEEKKTTILEEYKKTIDLEEYKKKLTETNKENFQIEKWYEFKKYLEALEEEGFEDVLIQNDDPLLNIPQQFKNETNWFKPQMDYASSRGTSIEGNIIFHDDDSGIEYCTLFVNGNNGRTIFSKESLQPILEYIKYVEERGGCAYIADTCMHSDVYYYAVRTEFAK